MHRAALALAAGLVLAGCGSSDQNQIRAVGRTVYDGGGAKDPSAACKLIVEPLKSRLEKQAGSCEGYLQKAKPPLGAFTVTDIKVKGTTATATVTVGRKTETATWTFVKTGEDWKLSNFASDD